MADDLGELALRLSWALSTEELADLRRALEQAPTGLLAAVSVAGRSEVDVAAHARLEGWVAMEFSNDDRDPSGPFPPPRSTLDVVAALIKEARRLAPYGHVGVVVVTLEFATTYLRHLARRQQPLAGPAGEPVEVGRVYADGRLSVTLFGLPVYVTYREGASAVQVF